MSKKELAAFLVGKAQVSERLSENREQKKNAWLQAVKLFFADVASWLKEHENTGVVRYRFEPMEIFEKNIGRYQTESMVVEIGEDDVLIEPIGKFVVGAHGRIDMKGKNGAITFVLVDKNAGGFGPTKKSGVDNDFANLSWKIATAPPDITYIDLNADTFSDALLELIHD